MLDTGYRDDGWLSYVPCKHIILSQDYAGDTTMASYEVDRAIFYALNGFDCDHVVSQHTPSTGDIKQCHMVV